MGLADSVLLCFIAIIAVFILIVEITAMQNYQPVVDNFYHNPPPLVYCHIDTDCVPYIRQFGRK